MDIKFKIMEKKDISGVIELCNESFKENTNLKYALKIYKKFKKDQNQIYIIGIVDKKIVAHLKITIIPTIYEPMNTYAILNHVCVKEDYRRHGFATKMLDYAFDICKQKGCKKVELWSNNVRTAAHACYYNYGFGLDDAGFFSKKI